MRREAVLLALIAAVLFVAGRVRKFLEKPLYTPEQVQEKIAHKGYRAQLRLTVIGPASADPADLDACLDRLADAYGAYAQAFGNELVVARRLKLKGPELSHPEFVGRVRRTPVLNARELAGLWHLPHCEADVPLLERTGARRVLPLPERVASGCRIGESVHQGRSFPVCLPDAILLRHLLALAKTGRGKSSLLLGLALYVMRTLAAGGKRAALILIDPHRDLARQTLSLVPEEREPDLVYLDASNQARPFGLNLVDAGLGWSRDQMLTIVLDILRREFSEAWGLRMEPAFRYTLATLFEANQTICARNPNTGRDHQHTILDIPPLFSDLVFRRGVLRLVADREVKAWWAREVDRLPHTFQVEVTYPVESKVFKFAGIEAARHIFGQSRSTIDPLTWVSSGKVVIINTDAVLIGRDAAALIGDLLLNLITLTIARQAIYERQDRARAMVIVDELQAMPGADYPTLLSEMGKFGASLVLATQSLGRLEALDRELNRGLKATLFANIDTLLAFNASGEDARYLELELGEQVNRHDVAALGDFECYLRLPAGQAGSQSLCWVRLDPPPPIDLERQQLLAEASAGKYGRDVAEVERSLRAAFDRIERAHRTLGGTKKRDGGGGASTDPPASSPAAPGPSGGPRSPSAAGTSEAPAPDRNATDSATGSNGQQSANASGQGRAHAVPTRSQHRNDPSKREAQSTFLDSHGGIASDGQRQPRKHGSKAHRSETEPEAGQA